MLGAQHLRNVHMVTFRTLVFVSLLSVAGNAEQLFAQPADPVLSPCYIKLKNENLVRIPAQEAGVLIEMPVREGSMVKAGQLLARVDDRDAKAQLRITENALKTATKRAEDDIEIRYAEAAADVAKANLLQDLEANQNHTGAVPEIEIRQKRLELQRAVLQGEKAAKDQVLAGLEADTKEAERDAAKEALLRRIVEAPFDGEVIETSRHESEWVNPGDLILKLARFDTLYVEGTVYANEYDRSELQGREVTVTVKRARGRELKVTGKVVHVVPEVRSDRSYIVRAEIQNKREGESWAIQPGLEAKMKIHLK